LMKEKIKFTGKGIKNERSKKGYRL